MENAGINWGEILAVVVPALIAAGSGLFVVGLVALRKFVKSTDNKIDDAILKAFDEANAKSKDESKDEA